MTALRWFRYCISKVDIYLLQSDGSYAVRLMSDADKYLYTLPSGREHDGEHSKAARILLFAMHESFHLPYTNHSIYYIRITTICHVRIITIAMAERA